MNPRFKQLALRTITRRHGTFRDLRSKQWVLCEKESSLAPPAIYLPDDLDRVKQVMEDTFFARELGRAKGGLTEHAASVAYQLTDVELYQGSLFKGAMRDPLVRRQDLQKDHSPSVHIPDAALASTYYGSFYFGHWMMDDLTMHLAAETTGSQITIVSKPIGHQPEYRSLFGIESSLVTRAHFDSLVIFEDHGQNSFKRKRYNELRSRLWTAVESKGNERVFIRRSGGVKRSLMNDEELESTLADHGFLIFDPMKCTARESVEQLLGAKLVVGVEGSHLNHALYTMAEGGALCVLQPPTRFTNINKDFADSMGLRYAFMTGTEVNGGFIIEPDRLERLLTMVEHQVSVCSLP